ncbi:MAG: RNA 2',3'-cyclic phosphodiesterase [Proteobacteria bacterium]|nr:RNA 2',3'-cyclic phosphodiesterase [Pseudomonadota bacterium]MBS0574001.1 RNA 2',3'-cyclic phosphodiesterase [Pseudomonadota bacterium]
MRAFLAIDLPDEAAARLADLQARLRVGHAVPPENLHLTVAFLGEQGDGALEELHFLLERLPARPFTLSFGPLACFGGGAPRSLHAEIRPTPELAALHRQVMGALHSAGIETERRRFRPHVTLSRLPPRMTAEENAALVRYLATFAAAPLPDFTAASLTLYRSTLRPEGAVHDMLADYPFG